MRRTKRSFHLALPLAAGLLLALSSPADASPGSVLTGSYWYNFTKWWSNIFGSTSGVLLVALGVGVASLFIITRGKWRK